MTRGDHSRGGRSPEKRPLDGSSRDVSARDPLLVRLRAPIPIAPLVYLRVLFGGIMVWEVVRYFQHGWIERYYMRPELLFTYFGFEWVRPWPGDGMLVHFALLGILALCVAVGAAYRVTAPLFFAGFTYVFLLDESRYLNHFYLVALVSLVLAALPAHRALSVDAVLRPRIVRSTMPAWMLWLLRALIGIPYFFGGIAKLSPDWLRGEPMRMWLAERTDFPVIGRYFTSEAVVIGFSWGGMLLDLLAVPLLLWHRTRWVAVVALAAFHLTNAQLFDIGIFPWLMLAATAIYFRPEGLQRVMSAIARTRSARLASSDPRPGAGTGSFGMALAGVFLLVQVLLPLRHHLYPGDVNWTEEGHRFSWHMKLRDKEGSVTLLVSDDARTWTVRPRRYLARHQVSKLVDGPDMILQLAHHVAEDYRRRGHRNVEVRAIASASLNGREPQALIDPTIDLAAERRSLGHAPWILPLEIPLERRARNDHDR